jgi:hypothetical protein
LSVSLCACTQSDNIKTTRHTAFSFGSSTITVKETSYPAGVPVLFLHLHSNETTADELARIISETEGIDYLQILNEGERFIEFEMANQKKYSFDPNRMFSREGIIASLKPESIDAGEPFKAVNDFRGFLLNLLDLNRTIVAVHNNTDGGFSLAEYSNNGTGLVHQNPLQDPDDFFITTDSTLFQQIKEKGFNVVYEYSEKLKDDGSLSIYCSRNKISYVNVEAEHGHNKEQAEMLQVLIEILKQKKK